MRIAPPLLSTVLAFHACTADFSVPSEDEAANLEMAATTTVLCPDPWKEWDGRRCVCKFSWMEKDDDGRCVPEGWNDDEETVTGGGGGAGGGGGGGGGESGGDTTFTVLLVCAPPGLRGETVNCGATAQYESGGVNYSWEFTPRGNMRVWDFGTEGQQTLPTVTKGGGDEWSGKAVFGGTVKVSAEDSNGATADTSASFYVESRTDAPWTLNIGFAQGAHIQSQILAGSNNNMGANRDKLSGSTDSNMILQGLSQVTAEQVASGPNQGYWYTTGHGYRVDRTWHVNSRITQNGPREILWNNTILLNAWRPSIPPATTHRTC